MSCSSEHRRCFTNEVTDLEKKGELSFEDGELLVEIFDFITDDRENDDHVASRLDVEPSPGFREKAVHSVYTLIATGILDSFRIHQW